MFVHKSQNLVEIYDDYFNTLQNLRGLEKSVKVAQRNNNMQIGETLKQNYYV
jgi:hypothetical protein